ncbi:MAG TPA: hypothetical protein VMW51_11240, partial [Terriglobia bacterium]|nr:hypothetical protein [Terriglobia bacterium]
VMEDFMREQNTRIAGWGLAMLFVVSLSSPWLAQGAPGSKIKLPPIRVQVGEKAPAFALPSGYRISEGTTS